MANLVIPKPDAPLGECQCPNCGRRVELRINKLWYKFMLEVLNLINGGL